MRIEGCIIGFDEYMNLLLDDAEEIHLKTKSRKQLDTLPLDKIHLYIQRGNLLSKEQHPLNPLRGTLVDVDHHLKPQYPLMTIHPLEGSYLLPGLP
ncbi:unnamed protein product [Staurois parvus]|uniref:Small nuclear ribonucleoprotein E n=1 Tax=Staurois parvus TaxID=386267 RepID=A0ABN9BW52_9NEOB|nr:unnamed protein product [Staurois parvus]